MPTIARFYGIVIIMHQKAKEHNPPHIHAYYGSYQAKFLISNGDLLEGEFPNKGTSLVKEFILMYKKELEDMWDTGIYHQLPPLD